jgi:hypothetical protein
LHELFDSLTPGTRDQAATALTTVVAGMFLMGVRFLLVVMFIGGHFY